MARNMDNETPEFEEKVVYINRVAFHYSTSRTWIKFKIFTIIDVFLN